MLPDLTPDYLTGVLGSLVTACSARRLGTEEGLGYMSDVFRLTLSGPALPDTMIMKQAAADPATRSMAEKYRSYERESMFYHQLARHLTIPTPACFHNDANRFLLLLEDLGDQLPFSREGATRTQAFQAVRTLAILNSELPVEACAPFTESFNVAAQDFQSFVGDYVQSLAPAPASDLLRHYASGIQGFLPLLESQPQVGSHMDFRVDNLRFRGTELVVMDWGETACAPVGFDLAYFMTTSLSITDRRAWESALLQRYQEALDNVAGVDSSVLFNSYRLALPHCIYLAALAAPRDQAESSRLAACCLAAVSDHLDFLQSRFA